MHNKKGNIFGILFLALMLITVLGIFTSNQPATGFAVRSNTCFEGTDFGECSDIKPKYCDDGAFKNDCGRCGCSEGEVCQEDGSCLPKCEDGTVFTYCSENKPLLCSKGTLLENCFKCGCFPGQTCSDDGSCVGNIEVGAGAEREVMEEKETVATCSDETIYGDCSLQKPNYCDNGNLVDNCELCGCYQGESCSDGICSKETKEAGFWWNLFCRVFYYTDDDCIGDAIRYQNK